MIQEIKLNIGNAITQDTENLLNQYSKNFEALYSNFNSLKQRIDELENKLIEKLAEANDAQHKKFISNKDQLDSQV